MAIKTYRKPLLALLTELGIGDTTKVKQVSLSDTQGVVEVVRENTIIAFEVKMAGGTWHCSYTIEQMASIATLILLSALPQKRTLERLAELVADKQGVSVADSVVSCRVDFLLSRTVICVYFSPDITQYHLSLRNGTAERLFWAKLREDSAVAIENYNPNRGMLEQERLYYLLKTAKQTVIMRLFSNVAGVIEAQALDLNMPLLARGGK